MQIGLFIEPTRYLHLDGSSARDQPGIAEDVLGDTQTVMQVSLHLIEHILGSSPQQNGAGSGCITVQEVREIVIAQLPNFKELALRADVTLLDLLRPVHDLGARHPRDSDVVGFADTPDAGDVALEQEVLGQVGDSLFGDDHVGLPLQDEVAHDGDLLHLLGEGVRHGVFGLELHVGLALALLVLEGAVQQQDPGVLDVSAHLRVRDIFVDHDSVEHLALIEGASGNLLDLGVALDLEVELALVASPEDDPGGLEGEVGDQVAPPAGELGANAALQGEEDLVVLVDVDGAGALVDYGLGGLQCLVVGTNNYGGVDVHLDEGLGGVHELARQDDD
jgi:hypothetical protein